MSSQRRLMSSAARRPVCTASSAQWANRLAMVRRFARYCSALDPRTADRRPRMWCSSSIARWYGRTYPPQEQKGAAKSGAGAFAAKIHLKTDFDGRRVCHLCIAPRPCLYRPGALFAKRLDR